MLIAREKAIEFVTRVLKQKWHPNMAYNVVDAILINWIFPWNAKQFKAKDKEIKELKEASQKMIIKLSADVHYWENEAGRKEL